MGQRAVGIDLGTTFSAIAQVNKYGVPEILANVEGARITPSVILFDGDDIIVGSYAQQAALAYPDRVVERVKRFIGDPDYRFEIDSRSYTPEQLSSLILARLKYDAEQVLGHRVDHAVITVPAYFTDRQRRATKEAGELAGFNVLKLISEPTAAAFAYGLAHASGQRKLLVFDLGGGTFDVSIAEIKKGEITVLATAGDSRLGGTDWDEVLMRFAAEKFKARHGVNPLDDALAAHDLREKCVSAKLALSRRPRVDLFFDHQGRALRLEISRERFDELATGLMVRCEALTQRVLDDAGLRPEDVDTVLLAGGATRMPMIRGLIEEIFHRSAATDINPDECVSLGAALTAALESARLSGTEPPVDLRTHDVTSHALGMATLSEKLLHNSVIIGRNSRIPCERTRDDFTTSYDGQTCMDLWLVQGEEEDPLKCEVLGHFEFYGIPPRSAGETRLSVTYRYNPSGIVEVEAMDLLSGQVLAHRIATEEITLQAVAARRVPMQIALIIDCSGSMYGENIRQARKAANTFIARTLAEGRKISIIAFPGGLKSSPTADTDRLDEALKALMPIGSTPMHHGLQLARQALRPHVGSQRVYVVLTDGHPDDPAATSAEAHRMKRTGGRVITVGVGRHVQREFLEGLSTRPEDYHHCDESFELEGTFVNLATQLNQA